MHTKDSLRALLEAHDIPLHQWGRGEAKTFEHFLSELTEGESNIKKVLLRYSEGAGVKVYYQLPDRLLYLREKEQVYTDGRRRERKDMRFSVGEKMKVREDPLSAAYRALSEELGITERLPLTFLRIDRKGPTDSTSFPGLISLFEIHLFTLMLPDEWYRPEGYVERQKDKTSYFHWTVDDAEAP